MSKSYIKLVQTEGINKMGNSRKKTNENHVLQLFWLIEQVGKEIVTL